MDCFFIRNTADDGNWWEGFDSLICKYGTVPEYLCLKHFNSSNSSSFASKLILD